jgi:hypothetical protein
MTRATLAGYSLHILLHCFIAMTGNSGKLKTWYFFFERRIVDSQIRPFFCNRFVDLLNCSVSCGTFCAFLWHILCLPVAHKPKSLFVPCYGTFCAFPWHISLKVFLYRAVEHFVPCCGTFCAFPWHMVFCSLLSRITSQELQVKICKSRIASQELQVKNCKKSFRQFGHVFLAA